MKKLQIPTKQERRIETLEKENALLKAQLADQKKAIEAQLQAITNLSTMVAAKSSRPGAVV